MSRLRPALGIALTLVVSLAAAGEAKTFRLGVALLPPSRGNPYASTSTTNALFAPAVFDALTIMDDRGEIHPALALSWTPVDQTTWRFALRPNVRFSNGEVFDAAAVKAVFGFFAGPDAAGQSVAREVDFITGTRVVDPLTIEIVSAGPNILLPRYVAAVPIVAPAAFRRLGVEGFAAAPVGTGPFRLERWSPEKVVLMAFAQSWHPPKVDALEVIAVPDPSARIAALQTKAVDAALILNPDQIVTLKAAGLRTALRRPVRIQVLGLDTISNASPFRDVRVRQAMNYAVNRQAITVGLLGGLVQPAGQPVTENAIGFDPAITPYPYDPAKARGLLREAGYPKGFRFIAELPTGQGANDNAVDQQIVADLAAVGVQMEVRTIQLTQIIKNMTQGGWKGTAFQVDFTSTPSLDGLRAVRRHSCNWSAPWYCDRTIEPVISEAARTFDLDQRVALTRKVMRHYHDQATSLFLFPILSLDGLGPRVTGWEPWNDNLRYDVMDVRE